MDKQRSSITEGRYETNIRLNEQLTEEIEKKAKAALEIDQSKFQRAKIEADLAERKAKYALEIDPVQQKKAKEQAKEKETTRKTASVIHNAHQDAKSKVRVIKSEERNNDILRNARTANKEKVINKKTSLDIKADNKQTSQTLAQKKIDHEKILMDMLTKHYSAMTTKVGELKDATIETTKQTEQFTIVAEETKGILTKLNLAVNKALGAHFELLELLSERDKKESHGEIRQEKTEAVHDAMIKAIKEEGALDAKIKCTKIASDSNLRKQVSATFSKVQNKVNDYIAKGTQKELTALSKKVHNELTKNNGTPNEALERFKKSIDQRINNQVESSLSELNEDTQSNLSP